MDESWIEGLLRQLQAGKVSVEQALDSLRTLPYEKIGQVMFDHHRLFRKGLPEIVYGPGKTRDQLLRLVNRLVERDVPVLVTRLEKETGRFLQDRLPSTRYDEVSRCLIYRREDEEDAEGQDGQPQVLIVTAGTADLPVAEEAARCLDLMGIAHEMVVDAGVAGMHRLLESIDRIYRASVIVVVAGMEGALPSVIAGMAKAPVIAVPTSTGYGSNMGGLVPLLAMLNSCAPGIGVVNIDNGVGAALLAASIVNTARRP